MVVRSGNESIVRYDRERIRGYRIGGLVVFFLAVANLAVGLDEAAGYSRWGNRILAFGRYAVYMLPAAFIAMKVFKAGRAFSQAFVAIGPDGVRLHLLRKEGFTWVPLPEQRFKWDEIGDITLNGGFCQFRAGSHVHTLQDDNSPSPPTVAQLMAEWKGVQLPAQVLLVPPGKRPMPRLKQAAIMGGISLPLMGVVVAGGFWIYSRARGPYYVAGFGELTLVTVLGLMGMLGGTLFLTAIILILIEMNHRL